MECFCQNLRGVSAEGLIEEGVANAPLTDFVNLIVRKRHSKSGSATSLGVAFNCFYQLTLDGFDFRAGGQNARIIFPFDGRGFADFLRRDGEARFCISCPL